MATPDVEDDFEIDDDGHRSPWCRNFEGHADGDEFCGHHQISWCRICDKECPACVDDPRCPDCGCAMFEEYHEWDCCYSDEDDE